MIDAALRLVVADLNGWFRRRRAMSTGNDQPASRASVVVPLDPVVLSNLVDPDGSLPVETEDKVALVLTRIAEERNVGGSRHAAVREGGEYQRQTVPIYLDLQVLFAARFRRYEAGLGVLSDVIAYLQAKPVFHHQNTPEMAEDLERLDLTMLKLDYGEQNHLWGCLGAKYSPSAVYSLRLLPLGRPQLREIVPVIQELRVNHAGSLPS